MHIRFRLLVLAIVPFLVLVIENISVKSSIAQTNPIYQQRRSAGEQQERRGVQLLELNEYDQAILIFQQALKTFQEIKDREGESRTHRYLGITYQRIGEYEQALEQFQQSLEHSALWTRSDTLSSIGEIYFSLGKYPQALEYFEQAREQSTTGSFEPISGNLARHTVTFYGAIRAFNNLGEVYKHLGQSDQALESYQQALDFARKGGDRTAESLILRNIGANQAQTGQYVQALDSYQQALKIATKINDRAIACATIANIGAVYQQQGRTQPALEQYWQALSVAKEIGDRVQQSSILNLMGVAYSSLEQYQPALQQYQQALAIARELSNRSEERSILNNIGLLFKAQNQPRLAIAFLKASVNITQDIRFDNRQLSQELQSSYTQTVSDSYRTLARLLLDQGRLLEAEQVLDLLKQEEIKEYIRSIVEPTGLIQQTEIEQLVIERYGSLIQLGQAVANCHQNRSCEELKTQLRQLTEEYNQAVATIESRQTPQTLDPAAVPSSSIFGIGSKLLTTHPDTVLIHTVVLPDALYIFWIAHGGIANSVKVAVTEAELDRAIAQFRQSMNDCEQGGCDSTSAIRDIQAISQKLYGWLIPPPLRSELQQNPIKNLVFSLDRNIRYLPMSALFDGNQYLIEQYTVSTITSVGATQARTEPFNPQTHIALALGLSEAVPPGFAALDQVPIELDEIIQNEQATDPNGGVYPGLALLNQDFNIAAFDRTHDRQILHIATHGVFSPVSSYASYLLLGDKTRWSIAEIQNQQQQFKNLRLIVLSACETGLGGQQRLADGGYTADGREISAIAQAFIDASAGRSTVIASLWKVNDFSTSDLMQQFYQTLAQNTPEQKVSIAQAMQAAQSKLLRGDPLSAAPFSHPYYWSPFTIIGNGL
jgi:CHAT domain-containing protein